MPVSKNKKPVAKRTPKKYKLEMFFNDAKFTKQTDDIDSSILSLKPDELLTEMYVALTKDKLTVEKRLDLNQGRKLFQDDEFRMIFINNLTIY